MVPDHIRNAVAGKTTDFEFIDSVDRFSLEHTAAPPGVAYTFRVGLKVYRMRPLTYYAVLVSSDHTIARMVCRVLAINPAVTSKAVDIVARDGKYKRVMTRGKHGSTCPDDRCHCKSVIECAFYRKPGFFCWYISMFIVYAIIQLSTDDLHTAVQHEKRRRDRNARRRRAWKEKKKAEKKKNDAEKEKRALLIESVNKSIDAVCCICLDAPAAAKLVPCNHGGLCLTCARLIDTCCICRAPIDSVQ